MKAQAFDAVLRSFIARRPFRPFTVEMMSGTAITVDHPEALVLRGGAAVFLDRLGRPAYFDEESVVQIGRARNQAAR